MRKRAWMYQMDSSPHSWSIFFTLDRLDWNMYYFVEWLKNVRGYQEFVCKNIDTMIDCAIDCDSSPEVKLLLMDYKYQNCLYREHKFEL